jgi:hypothetical protein
VPPSSHFSELPTSVDAGIAWMLKKDPGQRPPNLVTAVRSLEQAAEESGISIPRSTSSQIYATPKTGVRPAAVTPTPARLASGIGSAATMDAGTLPPVDAAPGKRGPGLWIAVVLGALVVGGAVFFVVREQKPGEKAPSAIAANDGSGGATASAVTPAGQVDAAVAGGGAVVDVKPRLVTIDVAGVPDGTEVYGPRGLMGVAPGPIQVERGASDVILTFKADGYVTRSQAVTPDADQSLALTLEPKAGLGGGKGGGGGKGSGGKKGGGRKGGGKGSGTNPLIEDPFKQGAGGADRAD